MTLLIQASHVTFTHGGHDVFTDLTFEIRKDERIAVIGENGSGKSTLFRLLAKSLRAGTGRGHPSPGSADRIPRAGDRSPSGYDAS